MRPISKNKNMKKTREFVLSPHIWFYLDYDGTGVMCALEDHDIRDGGRVNRPDNLSWEEFFLRSVRDRMPKGESEYTKYVMDQAMRFLNSKVDKFTCDFDKRLECPDEFTVVLPDKIRFKRMEDPEDGGIFYHFQIFKHSFWRLGRKKWETSIKTNGFVEGLSFSKFLLG
jgi:hypothetical protein